MNVIFTEQLFLPLEIQHPDVIQISTYFSKSLNLIFIATTMNFGKNVRDLLGMQDPKGPYFDPLSEGKIV